MSDKLQNAATGTKPKHYALLGFSVIVEVCGTTAMKLSNGFSDPLFTLITIAAYTFSFSIFIVILRYFQLGLAYGIWGGAGTVLTTLIGIMAWGEPFTLYTGLGVAMVIGGIILLNAGVDDLEKQAEANREANVARINAQ